MTFHKRRKSELRWYRRALFALPIAAVVLISGVAFAIFTAEATGNDASSPGHATTATAGTQAVTVNVAGILEASGTVTPLTPTTGTTPVATDEQIVTASITSSAASQITGVTATVLTGTGANSAYVLNAANGGAPAIGCLASWYVVNTQDGLNNNSAGGFAFSSDVSLPAVEPALGTNAASIGATVWLQDPTGSTAQNACAGVQPEVELAVS